MDHDDVLPGPGDVVLIDSSDDEELAGGSGMEEVSLFPSSIGETDYEENSPRIYYVEKRANMIEEKQSRGRKRKSGASGGIEYETESTRRKTISFVELQSLLDDESLLRFRDPGGHTDAIVDEMYKKSPETQTSRSSKERESVLEDFYRCLEFYNFDQLNLHSTRSMEKKIIENDNVSNSSSNPIENETETILHSIEADISYWKSQNPSRGVPLFLSILRRSVKRCVARGIPLPSSKKVLKYFRNVGDRSDKEYGRSIALALSLRRSGGANEVNQDLNSTKMIKTGVPFPNVGHQGVLRDLFSAEVIPKWSLAQLMSWRKRWTNPNMYYYRFPDPLCRHLRSRGGKWTEDEHDLFISQYSLFKSNNWRVGSGWGIFSKPFAGRVGYQCSNYYRHLLTVGILVDPTYIVDPETGKLQQRRRDLYDENEKEIPLEQCTLSEEWYTEEGKEFEREIDAIVGSCFPDSKYDVQSPGTGSKAVKPRHWTGKSPRLGHRGHHTTQHEDLGSGHRGQHTTQHEDLGSELEFNSRREDVGEIEADNTFGSKEEREAVFYFRSDEEESSDEISVYPSESSNQLLRRLMEKGSPVKEVDGSVELVYSDSNRTKVYSLRGRKSLPSHDGRNMNSSLSFGNLYDSLPNTIPRLSKRQSRLNIGIVRSVGSHLHAGVNADVENRRYPFNLGLGDRDTPKASRPRVTLRQSTLQLNLRISGSEDMISQGEDTEGEKIRIKNLHSIVRSFDVLKCKEAMIFKTIPLEEHISLSEVSSADGTLLLHLNEVKELTERLKSGNLGGVRNNFRLMQNADAAYLKSLSQATAKVSWMLGIGREMASVEPVIDEASMETLEQILLNTAPLKRGRALKAQILVRVRMLHWINTHVFRIWREKEYFGNSKPFHIEKFISLLIVDLLALFEHDSSAFSFPPLSKRTGDRARNSNILHALMAYLFKFCRGNSLSFWKLFNDSIFSFNDQRIVFIELVWHFLFFVFAVFPPDANWRLITYLLEHSPIVETDFVERFILETSGDPQHKEKEKSVLSSGTTKKRSILSGISYEKTLYGGIEEQAKWYCRKLIQRVSILETSWPEESNATILLLWKYILRNDFVFPTQEIPRVLSLDWRNHTSESLQIESFPLIFTRILQSHMAKLDASGIMSLTGDILFSLPRKAVTLHEGTSNDSLLRLRNMCVIVVSLASSVPKSQMKALLGRLNSLLSPGSSSVEALITLSRSFYILGMYYSQFDHDLSGILQGYTSRFSNALEFGLKSRSSLEDVEIGFSWLISLLSVGSKFTSSSSSFQRIIKSVSDDFFSRIFLPRHEVPLGIVHRILSLVKTVTDLVCARRKSLNLLDASYNEEKRRLDGLLVVNSSENAEIIDVFESITPEDLIELHAKQKELESARSSVHGDVDQVISYVHGRILPLLPDLMRSIGLSGSEPTIETFVECISGLIQILVWSRNSSRAHNLIQLFGSVDTWGNVSLRHTPFQFMALILKLEPEFVLSNFKSDLIISFLVAYFSASVNRLAAFFDVLQVHWADTFLSGILIKEDSDESHVSNMGTKFVSNLVKILAKDKRGRVLLKTVLNKAFVILPKILLKNQAGDAIEASTRTLYSQIGYLVSVHSDILYDLDLWSIFFHGYFRSSPTPVQTNLVVHSLYYLPLFMLGMTKLNFVYSEKVKEILHSCFQIGLESVTGHESIASVENVKLNCFVILLTCTSESVKVSIPMYRCLYKFENVLRSFRSEDRYVRFRQMIMYQIIPRYIQLPPIYPSHIRQIISAIEIIRKSFVFSLSSKDILDEFEFEIDTLLYSFHLSLEQSSSENLSLNVLVEALSFSRLIISKMLQSEAVETFSQIVIRRIIESLRIISRMPNSFSHSTNFADLLNSEDLSSKIAELRKLYEERNLFVGFDLNSRQSSEQVGSRMSGQATSPVQYRSVPHFVNTNLASLKEALVEGFIRGLGFIGIAIEADFGNGFETGLSEEIKSLSLIIK